MLHRSFKPAKCKTSLKLATSRIKLMRNKKENHLKQLKRDLAQLLESGQDQTARIRVEHVVREEKTIAAYDLLDIYCELIVARLPIIDSQKNCPIDMKEAVASVVFATPRCADIPELQDVRKHFTAKYGKEFVNAALELRPDSGVSRMLVEKLSTNAPDGQTKLKILSSIAEEYNVEWDPKSFGEKESKPYDDLLKGPGTYDEASKIYSEPPIVQAPPTQGHDQERARPVKFQQNMHSSGSNNIASSDFSGGQSVPSTAPHPPERPSGTEFEDTKVRHSHSRDANAFPLSGQNRYTEFKDATAAAQAAAESAERASMAARAAVELSSQGKITSQHSSESHKPNADGLGDDRPRKYYDSPSEKFVKEKLTQDGYIYENRYDADERFYKEDSAQRYSQPASSTAFVTVDDDKRPMNKVDRYSIKGKFQEETIKPENSASLSDTRVTERINGDDHNIYSHSSFSNDKDDYNNPLSHQNFVFDESKDPFDNGNSRRDSLGSGSIGASGPVFDSYAFDDDIIKFDKQPQYDEQEPGFYSPSITRESSKNFAVNTEKKSSWDNASSSSVKPVSASCVSSDLFSLPKFDETSPKAPSSAHLNDLGPATFDNSGVPRFDSEDELEKSSFHGKSNAGTSSYNENEIFRKSDYLDEHHGIKGELTEKNDSGSSRKQNLLFTSDDREYTEVGQNKHREESGTSSYNENEIFRKSDYLDEHHGIKGKLTEKNDSGSSRKQNLLFSSDDREYTEVGQNKHREEFSSQSQAKFDDEDLARSESRNELKFSTLTGGLRNKGYKTPPYRKNPLGDSSTLKEAAEDSSIYTQNYDLGTDNFEAEHIKSKREEHAVKEDSSSKSKLKKYDAFEEELPKLKLANKQERKEDYTKSKYVAFEEELPMPRLANKQERTEDYIKSKFSAPAGYFGPDDDDSEEDLPKQAITSKARAGSVVSRRTKANSDSQTTSHSKARHGSVSEYKPDITENRSKPRPQSEKHTVIRPASEEKQKPSSMEQLSSPLKATTSSDAPCRESSFKKSSHVHPKLPDYDSIAAHLQSLRSNRD